MFKLSLINLRADGGACIHAENPWCAARYYGFRKKETP